MVALQVVPCQNCWTDTPGFEIRFNGWFEAAVIERTHRRAAARSLHSSVLRGYNPRNTS